MSKQHRKSKGTAGSLQFQRIMASLLLALLIIIAGLFLYRLIFPNTNKTDTGISLSNGEEADTNADKNKPKYTFYDNLKNKQTNESAGNRITLESANGDKRAAGSNAQHDNAAEPKVVEQVASAPDNQATKDMTNKVNTAASPAGKFHIQIGAFRNADSAKRLQAKMILNDYPAYLINDVSGINTVQIGPYASREVAKKVLEQLKKEGVSTLLKED